MFDEITQSINNAVDKMTDPQGGMQFKISLTDDAYLKLGLTIIGAFSICYLVYKATQKLF
jgi:hypothetical protein